MKNKTFFIKELPKTTEMIANTMQGLIEGMEYLIDNNYKINHQASTIIGINYIIYANKQKKDLKEVQSDNQKIIDLEFKIQDLEEEILKLKKPKKKVTKKKK